MDHSSLTVTPVEPNREREFQQPLLVQETFVDLTRHRGTICRAANWTQAGATKGNRRTGDGCGACTESIKRVFVQTLQLDARRILSVPMLDPRSRTGAEKMELTAMTCAPCMITSEVCRMCHM